MSNRKLTAFQEVRITTEGWIYLIVLSFISVGAVLRNVNLLILMAGMMFAPMLINWRLSVFWLRHLSAKRSLPHYVYARQLSNVQWNCRNDAHFSVWSVEIRDNIVRQKIDLDETSDESQNHLTDESSDHLPSIEPSHWRRRWLYFFGFRTGVLQRLNAKVDFMQIGPQRSEAASYRAYFSQRGVYWAGPAIVSTRFPFGLIATRLLIPNRETFYVAPALGKLKPNWDRRMRSVVAGADAIKRTRGLDEDEFYALRPWRSGDSRKQIHWRSSAKAGYPIVKQFEQPDNRDFALLLDLHLPNAGDDLARRDCETALRFAASILLHVGTAVQGNMALAICGNETSIFRSRNHREFIENAMPNLAVVQPTTAPQVATSLLELAKSVSESTPLYVFSTRIKPSEMPIPPTIENPQPAKLRNAVSEHGAQLQKLNSIWSTLRWVVVDSAEFRQLFVDESSDTSSQINSLAEKWITEDANH